jgi:hypothetical protein
MDAKVRRAGGWKIWTRYSGHCFSHLKWNVDTGEKIGHVSLGMGGKSIETTSQKLDECWAWLVSASVAS